MAMVIGSRVTYAEFRDLPDDGVLYELLDGAVVTRASPTGRHQDLIGDLYARLRAAAQAANLGFVRLGPFDVVLDEYNATLPDLIFVRTERAAIVTNVGCFGPPDLIVEALSPTSIERDLRDKLGSYERGGVTHYWVLDPVNEQVRRIALAGCHYVEQPLLSREDNLTTPLFPNLQVSLRDLFASANLVQALAREPQAPDVDPERVRFLEQWHLRPNQRRTRPRRQPPSS
jgi:Uma2 family endonuclease